MFLLEPLLVEELADVGEFDDVVEGVGLGLQVAALEADDAVGEGVALGLGDVLADDLHEVGQGHDGAADHEVVAAFLVLAAQVFGLAVAESDGLTDLLGDADLFARAVDKFETAVGEEDGQGDAGEAAACAEVEDLGAGTEADDLGDGQRVEHVVEVEAVDVLAGDDVDLGVPVAVEVVEGLKLPLLLLCEVGEVFQDDVGCHDQYSNEFLSRSLTSLKGMISSVEPTA